MTTRSTVRRSTTRRDRHRRHAARGHPPCAICNQPIDYDAHHLDPMSFTVDHIVPLAAGGTDTIDNIQPAHRKCNRDKGASHPDSPDTTWTTWRTWN